MNDNQAMLKYPERKLILVVENSSTQALRLQALLESENCYTLLAVDGEMGIRMAQPLLPNLILLNLQMPKLNSLEVCRELKNDTRTAKIPIILLSRYCEDEIGKLTQELGVLEYIPKNAIMERILIETLMQLEFLPSSANKYPPPIADDHV